MSRKVLSSLLIISLCLMISENESVIAATHTHTDSCRDTVGIKWHIHSEECEGLCGYYGSPQSSYSPAGHGYVYKCSNCGYNYSYGHSSHDGSCLLDPSLYTGTPHYGYICGMKNYCFYDPNGNLLKESNASEYDTYYTKTELCNKVVTGLSANK